MEVLNVAKMKDRDLVYLFFGVQDYIDEIKDELDFPDGRKEDQLKNRVIKKEESKKLKGPKIKKSDRCATPKRTLRILEKKNQKKKCPAKILKKKNQKKKHQVVTHHTRICQAIEFFRENDIKAASEMEERVFISDKEGRTCFPDFVAKARGRILYGEVGSFSLDKICWFYLNREVVWISKKKFDWKEFIYYFYKGKAYLMTFDDALLFFLKRRDIKI